MVQTQNHISFYFEKSINWHQRLSVKHNNSNNEIRPFQICSSFVVLKIGSESQLTKNRGLHSIFMTFLFNIK